MSGKVNLFTGVLNILGALLIGVFSAHAMLEQFPVVSPLGVELKTGAFTFSRTDMTVGPSGSGLVFSRSYNSQESRIGPMGKGWSHNFEIRGERKTESGQVNFYVIFASSSQKFARTSVGSLYNSDQDNGPGLMSIAAGGLEEFEYKTASGDTLYFLPSNSSSCADAGQLCDYYIDYIQKADGEKLHFSYQVVSGAYKLRSINSSLGWNASFEYDSSWRLTSVQMVNLAEDYCAPSYGGQAYCNLTNWPRIIYAYSGTNLVYVKDTQNNYWRYAYTSGLMTGVRKPSSASLNKLTIHYSANKVFSQVINGAGTWDYTYSGNQTVITNPLNESQTVHFGASGRPDWVKDVLNRQTSFLYDSSNRLTRQTNPEGDYVNITYDANGNVIENRMVAKSGSGLADIVTTASFPTSCNFSQMALCRLPVWTRDARGKQTDYTYATDGRPLIITAAPAVSGGVRAQQRFIYSQFEAYIKNSGGSFIANGNPVWRLAQTSTCANNAAPGCIGTADEMLSTFSYGSNGVANNRALTRVIQDPAGLAFTSTISYDRVGNALTVDGPLVGTADISRTRYDSERRVIGSIAPDPDGGGVRIHAATRLTYNVDGQLIKTQQGTVTSQSDAAWAAFTVLQTAETSYDSAGRSIKQLLKVGSTIHGVSQVSYDGASRPECVAQRMNPAVFSSLPSSACTQGTAGSFGPDFISRVTYDAIGRTKKVYSAYGTPLVQNTSRSYTLNGQTYLIFDAKGNKTRFEYDGFNRLIRTSYPLPANGRTSSTTDYEQTAYDAYGRIANVRKRGGSYIYFTYNDLGRLTVKNLPATTAEDVYYSYDLLGRALGTRFGSTSGPGITNTIYNKAGQVTSITSHGRTMSYQYDSGGRRSRMTWPDNFYVTYSYNNLSRLTAIREYGAGSGIGVLASFTYDDLGRPTTMGRGNGADNTYGYDALSRLSTLGYHLSGTSNDYSASFTYSPASQITSRDSINDGVYRWTGSNETRNYTYNDLNQMTVAADSIISHDLDGNLTGDGVTTYSYDGENKLRTVRGSPGQLDLTYDPFGRLRQTEVPGISATRTEFLYDGVDMVAEYNNSGTLTRRYVHGAGIDAPLVMYEGSGTTTRRWLHADERGSIVTISDASGNGVAPFPMILMV